jgi:hypothetical protein
MKVGKIAWGSPVWADGKIYVPEVDGGFHIVRAGETDAEILSSIHFSIPKSRWSTSGVAPLSPTAACTS